jgi:uroporphyrinogen-III synthase
LEKKAEMGERTEKEAEKNGIETETETERPAESRLQPLV